MTNLKNSASSVALFARLPKLHKPRADTLTISVGGRIKTYEIVKTTIKPRRERKHNWNGRTTMKLFNGGSGSVGLEGKYDLSVGVYSPPESAPAQPPGEAGTASIEPPIDGGNAGRNPEHHPAEQAEGLPRPPAKEDQQEPPIAQGDAKRDAESAAQEIGNIPSPARPAGDDEDAAKRDPARSNGTKTRPTK